MAVMERFEFSNVVIQDYSSFKKQQPLGTKDVERLFVKQCGNKYYKEFFCENMDEEMCEYMTKIYIYRIIINYINVNNISSGIGVMI